MPALSLAYVGSFEGTLKLRQRLGKVSLHIAGPCPLLEIDVAEGDIEISLPIDSASPSTVNGLLDISASSIKLDKNTTPEDALDNWDISEGPGEQRFCGKLCYRPVLQAPNHRKAMKFHLYSSKVSLNCQHLYNVSVSTGMK